jgi:hypothetical protein
MESIGATVIVTAAEEGIGVMERVMILRRSTESLFLMAAPEQNYPPWYLNSSSSLLAAGTQRGLRGVPAMASNDSTTTTLTTNATNDAELGYTNEYEKTDHNRMIFMTVILLVLMVFYIGFCAYYGKWNRVEDTTIGTRDRQRIANQVRILFCLILCIIRVKYVRYLVGSDRYNLPTTM